MAGSTKGKRLNGAQILVRTLIDQGVDTVFGYPGGTVLDIYDALYANRSKIRHIETTHEQHACHAADGYARATGRVGVVIATSGPGATNLVTGIATAFLDSVPLVAITGNVANADIGTDSFQELDITGVTLPITKHNYFVRDVSRLQDVVREAFELAASGRPGPVLIDIPKDVQAGKCAFEPLPPAEKLLPEPPTSEELVAAAIAINSSHKPYVYFGGGAIASGAADQVVALAEKIGAPMGCSLMGVSGVPSDHALFLGMQGMHGHYASSVAMHRADCVIALGVRFNDRATGNRSKFGPNGKIVHVDIDSSELSKTTDDKARVTGDVADVLERLLPMLEPAAHRRWLTEVNGIRARERELEDTREGMTPRNVMEAINAHLTPNTPVVTDVGQHQMWAAQYLRFSQQRRFVSSGGLGTMGFGMGAAIGAHLGTGERVVLVTGDGSFGMNLAEMITAVGQKVPVAIVLLNNKTLGMVRQLQRLFYRERHSCTNLDRAVDYVALAKAFGADGEKVESVEDLDAALGRALSHKGPYLIEVPIDKDEFVSPMVPGGGTMDDIIVNPEQFDTKAGK